VIPVCCEIGAIKSRFRNTVNTENITVIKYAMKLTNCVKSVHNESYGSHCNSSYDPGMVRTILNNLWVGTQIIWWEELSHKIPKTETRISVIFHYHNAR
jgi:hypothetical protein